jgi:hypothetical protein
MTFIEHQQLFGFGKSFSFYSIATFAVLAGTVAPPNTILQRNRS